LSRKAAATEDDFASLHIGLQSLGRTLENWNFEVAEYSNPDKSLDIPVFRIAKDGRQTNVWARAFIAGQDPEPLFTPEETARFSEESKLKGRDVAFVIVRCKDIGKGYTLGFTGLDSLKHSANLGTLSYISKDSRPSQSA